MWTESNFLSESHVAVVMRAGIREVLLLRYVLWRVLFLVKCLLISTMALLMARFAEGNQIGRVITTAFGFRDDVVDMKPWAFFVVVMNPR